MFPKNGEWASYLIVFLVSLVGSLADISAAGASGNCIPGSIDRPGSGEILQQTIVGEHELHILNGTGQDTLIKLKGLDNSVVLTFFVRANSNAIVTRVPEGVFVLYGAVGSDFSAACLSFATDMAAFKFEGYAEFETTEDSQYIYTTVLEYTLHEVVGGNIDKTSVPLEEF